MVESWYFGETKKPPNQEPRNQKTMKPVLFSNEGIPSTPQHTDSHPCTRPGRFQQRDASPIDSRTNNRSRLVINHDRFDN